MGYSNGKNKIKAFVGRVEMAMPFNLSKPLNSFNTKIYSRQGSESSFG